jgi:hypothetical protein
MKTNDENGSSGNKIFMTYLKVIYYDFSGCTGYDMKALCQDMRSQRRDYELYVLG